MIIKDVSWTLAFIGSIVKNFIKILDFLKTWNYSPKDHQSIRRQRRVLRTMWWTLLLRSCAPKTIEMMSGGAGKHPKPWKSWVSEPLKKWTFELFPSEFNEFWSIRLIIRIIETQTQMVTKDVSWTLAFIGSIVKEFHQNTGFSENLKLQSEGPPEHQKTGESASHHVMNHCFCAAARRRQ